MWRKSVLTVGVLLLLQSAGWCQTPDISEQVEVNPDQVQAAARQTRLRLQERITVHAVAGKVKLGEALEYLVNKYDFPTICVDDAAFERLGIKDIEERLVTIPELKRVSKGAALAEIFAQVGAYYVVEGDCLEVVPFFFL